MISWSAISPHAPKDRVVLEMLESIEIDDEVLGACRRLKQMGYLLALGDFLDRPEWKPLRAEGNRGSRGYSQCLARTGQRAAEHPRIGPELRAPDEIGSATARMGIGDDSNYGALRGIGGLGATNHVGAQRQGIAPGLGYAAVFAGAVSGALAH